MRRSARHIGIEPESIGTKQALPPSLPVKGKAAKGGRSAKDSIRTIQGEYEEPVLAGPITTGSDKRNEPKDSGKVSSVAQVIQIESSSRPKRKARGRRHLKAKSDLEPPVHPNIQNTKGETAQLEIGAAVKKREKEPLRSPEDDFKPLNDLQELTEESYEVGIPVPESAVEDWDFIHSKRQPHQYDNQSAEDEDNSHLDPRQAFNIKWGYLPPLSEEATRIIDFIIANPAMAKSQYRISAGSDQFRDGLTDRNVNLTPSITSDPCKNSVQSLDVQNFMNEPDDVEKSHDRLWELDQAKITPTSSEALFQRTIMLSLIARHILIYRLESPENQIFEFSVEAPWTCLPMPSRALNDIERTSRDEDYVAPRNRFLTQPKPDLAVAFNRRAIMSGDSWKTLTMPMQTLASFEDANEDQFSVFHFLTIEAKKSEKTVDDRTALHQSSNCASQALFNFYEFFCDAGPDYKKKFFDKVRFFSIVTNRAGLLVRIHRAIEVPQESRGRRVMPHDADYLLEFEFEVLARLGGIDQFSRSKALDIMKKVLKYAKETMCPLIQDATAAICTKLNGPDSTFLTMRSHINTYRHGQPGIAKAKDSERMSVAPSENKSVTDATSLVQVMQKGNLGSQRAASVADEPMEYAQPTPKRAFKPKKSSNLKRPYEGSNKTGATPCSQDEATDIAKRQKLQGVNG